MDNLTHTLTGVALARLGLARRVEGATLTLALASNLPDLDIVSAMGGAVSYLEHHRGISHSFAASPFLAAGLAFVLTRGAGSTRRFLPTCLIAWFGVLLHLFWDLWTSYGTRVFLPFDSSWYTLDWMFIVDPAFLLMLAGICFVPKDKVKRAMAVLALAYIGARAFAHDLALGQARDLVGPEYTRVRALPEPLSLNFWRFKASSERNFAIGSVLAAGGERSKVEFPKVPDDAPRKAAQESHAARVFLDFSAFPRYEERREGDLTVMTWSDLRFSDRRTGGFLCEVKLDSSGHVVSDRIAF